MISQGINWCKYLNYWWRIRKKKKRKRLKKKKKRRLEKIRMLRLMMGKSHQIVKMMSMRNDQIIELKYKFHNSKIQIDHLPWSDLIKVASLELVLQEQINLVQPANIQYLLLICLQELNQLHLKYSHCLRRLQNLKLLVNQVSH